MAHVVHGNGFMAVSALAEWGVGFGYGRAVGHALEAMHSPELASLVFVFLLVNLFRRELV